MYCTGASPLLRSSPRITKTLPSPNGEAGVEPMNNSDRLSHEEAVLVISMRLIACTSVAGSGGFVVSPAVATCGVTIANVTTTASDTVRRERRIRAGQTSKRSLERSAMMETPPAAPATTSIGVLNGGSGPAQPRSSTKRLDASTPRCACDDKVHWKAGCLALIRVP